MSKEPQRVFTLNDVNTMTRLAMARAAAGRNTNVSDVYEACNYPEDLDADDFERMYAREGVASKVVDIWPDECWGMPPEVYDDNDITVDSPFEAAFRDVEKALKLWKMCHTLDKQSGVGRWGVMYLSINDAKSVADLRLAPVDWPQDQDYSIIENILPPEGTKPPEHKCQFIRVLPERYAKIQTVETNVLSPRYGQPLTYALTFVGDTGTAAGNQDAATYEVHWTRVVHCADNTDTSPIAGRPRQQRVYNRLIDLMKAYGGSSQGLWNGGFPGISFETLPGFEDAEFEDEAAVKAQLADYASGFQRWIFARGLGAKTMTPNVTNPGPFIEAYLQNVGMSIGVPWRKLLGSEQGQLASGEDGDTWDDRVIARCTNHCEDAIVNPVVRRLVWLGVLPQPKEGKFKISWPERSEPNRSDLATTAKMYTEAMGVYIRDNVSQLCPPAEWLELVARLPLEDVVAIEQANGSFDDFNAAVELQKQSAEAALKAAQQPPVPPGGAQPVPGKGVPPGKPPAVGGK